MSENLTYSFTLRLCESDRKFFGPGVVRLLQNVQGQGSLRSAAVSMGMAYSKAWAILKHAEDVLGFPLIESKKGGRNGGGAVVTKQGQAFVDRYLAFESALRRTADDLFAELFSDGPTGEQDAEHLHPANVAEETCEDAELHN